MCCVSLSGIKTAFRTETPLPHPQNPLSSYEDEDDEAKQENTTPTQTNTPKLYSSHFVNRPQWLPFSKPKSIKSKLTKLNNMRLRV